MYGISFDREIKFLSKTTADFIEQTTLLGLN